MKIASLKSTAQTILVERCSDGRGQGRVLPDPWTQDHSGTSVEFLESDLAAPIAQPGKVICVGLNFREHIAEMGHPIPDHPTLFVKFPEAITGPYETVQVPEAMSAKLDYEGELAVIIGPGGRIAGYSIFNDCSQRDWQYRTQQWLQGKNLEASSAFGPWFVTADSFDPVAEKAWLRTWVNGELRQEHCLADLVFKPQDLVDYIQTFIPLQAGDVIATGTPAGVGHGMKPPRYLQDGDEVTVAIDGIGQIQTRYRIMPTRLGAGA